MTKLFVATPEKSPGDRMTKLFVVSGMEDYNIVNGNTMHVWGETVSDSFHTLNELYEHRHALFAALIHAYDTLITPLNSSVRCWKSRLHADGTMFERYFIAGMSKRKFDGTFEHLAYHMPTEWWDKFTCLELPTAPEYDGYTPEQVIERLGKL